MKFSDEFRLALAHDDDWFDPVLAIDTHLFIGPFLLDANEKGYSVGSHHEVISFFNSVYQMIASSEGNNSSLHG